ncbi:hypothetical protein ABZ914_13850 [Spirillospora sp. NPDC046719]
MPRLQAVRPATLQPAVRLAVRAAAVLVGSAVVRLVGQELVDFDQQRAVDQPGIGRVGGVMRLVVQVLVPVAGDLQDLRWFGQARTDVAAAWY